MDGIILEVRNGLVLMSVLDEQLRAGGYRVSSEKNIDGLFKWSRADSPMRELLFADTRMIHTPFFLGSGLPELLRTIQENRELVEIHTPSSRTKLWVGSIRSCSDKSLLFDGVDMAGAPLPVHRIGYSSIASIHIGSHRVEAFRRVHQLREQNPQQCRLKMRSPGSGPFL